MGCKYTICSISFNMICMSLERYLVIKHHFYVIEHEFRNSHKLANCLTDFDYLTVKPESKPTQSTSNMNTNVKRLNTTSLLVEPFVSSLPMTTESPITMNMLSSVGSPNSELVDQHLNKNKQNTSCLDLLENCTKLPACAIALNKFRALCTVRTCNKLK